MKTKNLELFERYYNGEMEADEKASFERLLAADNGIKADYQEYLSIYDALNDREMLDLRMKLKEIREEMATKKGFTDFLSEGYNWLWLAALITIIVSFTFITATMIRNTGPDFEIAQIEPTEAQSLTALDTELSKFLIRQVEFNLISPADSIFPSRKEPLKFEWTVEKTEPLILELINWHGKVVFSTLMPVNSPYIVRHKFSGGIYAYRFRTQTEAYKIGFIFLR